MKPTKVTASLFLLLGFIISPLRYHAQTAREEVIKINQVFQGLKKYSMEVEIVNFTTGNNGALNSGTTTTYKKDGELLYVKQYHAETILNASYCINVDHQNKFIIISPREKVTGKDDQKSFQQNIPLIVDSAFKIYENVSLKKLNDRTNEIRFDFKKGGSIKHVLITYDASSHVIQSMRVDYASPVKQGNYAVTGSEMRYKNFVTNPVFDKQTFSGTTYVSFNKSKPVLNKSYAAYQLVDKLTKN